MFSTAEKWCIYLANVWYNTKEIEAGQPKALIMTVAGVPTNGSCGL